MNKIKWWQWILIIITAGVTFYIFYPKYYYTQDRGIPIFRCNKITGRVEWLGKGE